MFIDEALITLKAGHGGAGKVSFYPGSKSGPDGGNGGRGADVYVRAVTDLTALKHFTVEKTFSAENGYPGGSNRSSGKNGEDLELIMPVGTSLEDRKSGEQFELVEDGQRILLCKGGIGGQGNFEFKSSRNTTPMYAQPGLPGQIRELKVILKLIADFGLIGLPNAGKSSLLNELTSAQAKIANYPFTTLEPNLGVFDTYDKKIIADIPGLIEGAHQGKGLGIKFLKHIEKTKVLLHCIGADSADSLADYKTVRNELEKYNSELAEKREIIILTKSDICSSEELKNKIKALKTLKKEIIPVSVYDFDSIESLKKIIKTES